jgi:hypothetical protein
MVSAMDDLESLIGRRINGGYAEMDRLFSQTLYGDPVPMRRRGRIERFRIWLGVMRWRVKGAWLVLTGRADIS